jgi:C1A family cysteine protease
MKKQNFIWIIVSLALSLCFVFASSSMAAEEELANIKASIESKGAQWTAGENWVTRLSPEDRRNLLGEMTEITGSAEAEESAPAVLDSAPTAIDWRNKDGQNWITPIRDQSSCGSCVAFGSLATVESLARIETNQPGLDIDLSEMHLFNCGGGHCVYGWYNSSACYYLQNDGAPDEACWPYQPYNQDCSNTCPDWQDRAVKITSYGNISGISSCMNYTAIAPILVSFEVYTDFYYYTGGIYEYTYGVYEGGHAVSIVGYDTTGPTDYWIVKNSWGAAWGEGGYFRIKMGECNIENRSSYWMSGVILPGPGPCPGVDVSYDGYCDGMCVDYNLATGEVEGYQTGCSYGPTNGTVAKQIFSQGTAVTMVYDESATAGNLGIVTAIRPNGTWTHYKNDGGGIYIFNQGTWSPGPAQMTKDGQNLPRSTGP